MALGQMWFHPISSSSDHKNDRLIHPKIVTMSALKPTLGIPEGFSAIHHTGKT
jgi:hypothetical protein